ncbi:MAG: F0F1 ATP synthase subunit A [Candidatus Absconditabacterales bacterium]|nr:F0F1 ATP synthase subunit A [Candidatus Absconditabacterales bacterium]
MTLRLFFVCLLLGLYSLGAPPLFAVDIIVGSGVKNDPYYQMNSANLNTMNSYIIPVENDIDPQNYKELKYSISFEDGSLTFQKDTSPGYKIIHIMSSYVGYICLWFIFLFLWYWGVKKKDSDFGQVLRLIFEGIWGFFEDILGHQRSHWIKVYVVSLFFIILLSNLFGLFGDVIRFVFPQYLRRVTAPTSEFESTIAMALISILITFYVQMKAVGGPLSLLHEYVPVTGKGLFQGSGILTKAGDILISLFIGFLDIVGVVAKVVSLSIRLFGNMSSGSILLNVIFIGFGLVTVGLLGFNMPFGVPIIIYVQSILVSVVQAFVFSLLIGIGLVMADGTSE